MTELNLIKETERERGAARKKVVCGEKGVSTTRLDYLPSPKLLPPLPSLVDR